MSLPTSLVSAIDQTFTQTAEHPEAPSTALPTTSRRSAQAFSSYQNFNASQSDQQLIMLAQQRWQTSIERLPAFAQRRRHHRQQSLRDANSDRHAGQAPASRPSGQLQATQAGNQLLGVQSRQLSDLTALLAAQSRAAGAGDGAQGRCRRTRRANRSAASSTTARPISRKPFRCSIEGRDDGPPHQPSLSSQSLSVHSSGCTIPLENWSGPRRRPDDGTALDGRLSRCAALGAQGFHRRRLPELPGPRRAAASCHCLRRSEP